jgi:hypothetical protein
MRLPATLWLALMAWVGMTIGAMAHDWYDADCCSNRDCEPVPCEEMAEGKEGVHWDGMVFTTVRPSKDSKCHVCVMQWNRLGGDTGRKPLCAYIQQGS